MNEKKEKLDAERIMLFQRLMQKKDQILTSTHEIEDFRRKFVSQGRKDDSGEIESGIYKRIYSIIEGLSELVGYADDEARRQFHVTVDFATQNRTQGNSKFLNPDVLKVMFNDVTEYNIADNRVLDALAAMANSITITWKLKKEPLVNFSNFKLESIISIKLPGQ